MKRTLSKVRRVSIGLGLTRVPMHMGPTPREVGENHLQLICTYGLFFRIHQMPSPNRKKMMKIVRDKATTHKIQILHNTISQQLMTDYFMLSTTMM